MKGRIPVPVFIATALLLIYSVSVALDVPPRITGFLFFISPFFLIWMVISVLKDKTSSKELAEDEEWGYADKKKEDFGSF
ncbi:MAG: hypothetical protein Q8941_03025 [Bacteroidota bacterium]|nr:hypothetical protein [Bacteroidota bacterium]